MFYSIFYSMDLPTVLYTNTLSENVCTLSGCTISRICAPADLSTCSVGCTIILFSDTALFPMPMDSKTNLPS